MRHHSRGVQGVLRFSLTEALGASTLARMCDKKTTKCAKFAWRAGRSVESNLASESAQHVWILEVVWDIVCHEDLSA